MHDSHSMYMRHLLAFQLTIQKCAVACPHLILIACELLRPTDRLCQLILIIVNAKFFVIIDILDFDMPLRAINEVIGVTEMITNFLRKQKDTNW